MTSTQKQLTSFDSEEDTDETTNANPDTDDNSNTPKPLDSEFDPERSEFNRAVENQYPAASISTLSEGEVTSNLCLENGTTSATYSVIAGSGGMGSGRQIKNPADVFHTAIQCKSLPVMIMGGGMSTPMGSGATAGRLESVSKLTDDTGNISGVKVEVVELYQQQGRARRETRVFTIGSYQLLLPTTAGDAKKASAALTAWEQDRIDYLDPQKRQKHTLAENRRELFQLLTPADRIEIPVYESQLEVISEQFDTYAVRPRGTLSNEYTKVQSVTVNNPNGGYYQLGMEQPTLPESTNPEIPTIYISVSCNSPPTPNTAFTCDGRFSSTEVEVTPIKHPPNPTVIDPDTDILESPLPEPRLRTPLEEIDGIGEKTSLKLSKAVGRDHISAESVAHTLFNNGSIHEDATGDIERILSSLPKTDSIYSQIRQYTPQDT
jgi:hypothetical protein